MRASTSCGRPGRCASAIGVTLQEGALDDKLTGRELLRLQGRFYGLSRAEVERRIDEVSPILDVAAIDRRIGTYSGGMKRRLDVAASLIHNPRILFLDEPTTGLDPVSRAAVWEQVARLRSDFGMTIFLTTQYLEEADALADRVGIIDEGLLRAEGPPEELKRRIGADVIVVRLAEDGGRRGSMTGSGPGAPGPAESTGSADPARQAGPAVMEQDRRQPAMAGRGERNRRRGRRTRRGGRGRRNRSVGPGGGGADGPGVGRGESTRRTGVWRPGRSGTR